MKLYTEEQVVKLTTAAYTAGQNHNLIIFGLEFEKITPISVPNLSDIKAAAKDLNPLLLAQDGTNIFIEGAAWSIVQIKEQIQELNKNI